MCKLGMMNCFSLLGCWGDPKNTREEKSRALSQLILILMAQTIDSLFVSVLVVNVFDKSRSLVSLPVLSSAVQDWHLKKESTQNVYTSKTTFYHRFLTISWYIGFLHLIYVYSLAMLLLRCISLILQTKGITSSSTVYLYLQQLKASWPC